MRHWLVTLATLTACVVLPAIAADEAPANTPAPDQSQDQDPNAPKKEAPKPAPPAKPKKTEYEKLPYAALQKKADAGDLKAQFELGSRYNYGRDLPKNTREGLRWIRQAAQAGNTDAQRLLSVKLFEGHDVPVDHEEAFKWAQRLADSGDRPGQLMLGRMYANGEGTSRDLVRAYMWFNIAATPLTGKTLQDLDQKAMDAASDERDKTASLLQPEQEVEGQQLASDWWLEKKIANPAPPADKKKKRAKGLKKKPADQKTKE